MHMVVSRWKFVSPEFRERCVFFQKISFGEKKHVQSTPKKKSLAEKLIQQKDMFEEMMFLVIYVYGKMVLKQVVDVIVGILRAKAVYLNVSQFLRPNSQRLNLNFRVL